MKKFREKLLYNRAKEHLHHLLQKYNIQKKKILLALSGGSDSVFLGTLLAKELPKELLLVAHFDHRLRKSSMHDAEFCKEWAQKNALCFFSEQWENPEDSEEKARNARQAFLFSLAKHEGVEAIALGTHGDDNAETIFHHFLRGSGAKGLSGILEFHAETQLFRPILPFRKQEILSFLAEEKITFCEDETNSSSRYTRNFLRNEVFPLLQTRFPDFRENLLRQAEIFRRQSNFCEQSAEKFLEEQKEYISRKEFLYLPEAVQTEAIRQLFAPKNLDFSQIENVRAFFCIGKSGKKMLLCGKKISLFSDGIFLE
ncbi:tRNA lysidine(34) synthetase TilS [Candidatus Peregrinibacteria bacterium]|nr:MAG: tRNA lysidine(34) synthetase TilS [Candidatus Peregrinibacteria bacterium]